MIGMKRDDADPAPNGANRPAPHDRRALQIAVLAADAARVADRRNQSAGDFGVEGRFATALTMLVLMSIAEGLQSFGAAGDKLRQDIMRAAARHADRVGQSLTGGASMSADEFDAVMSALAEVGDLAREMGQ